MASKASEVGGRSSRRQFFADGCRLLITVAGLDILAGCGSGPGMVGEVMVRDGKLFLPLGDPRYRGLRRVGHGLYLVIDSGRKPLIVTRVGEEEVAAFSSECPHAGYQVLTPEGGVLICASGHGGRFDLRGKVIGGPPPRSLRNYPAELQGDAVVIAGIIDGPG